MTSIVATFVLPQCEALLTCARALRSLPWLACSEP